MNSTSLTPAQIAKLAYAIKRRRHYLDCLCGRMCQKHFPHADPLKLAAEKARIAMEEL